VIPVLFLDFTGDKLATYYSIIIVLLLHERGYVRVWEGGYARSEGEFLHVGALVAQHRVLGGALRPGGGRRLLSRCGGGAARSFLKLLQREGLLVVLFGGVVLCSLLLPPLSASNVTPVANREDLRGHHHHHLFVLVLVLVGLVLVLVLVHVLIVVVQHRREKVEALLRCVRLLLCGLGLAKRLTEVLAKEVLDTLLKLLHLLAGAVPQHKAAAFVAIGEGRQADAGGSRKLRDVRVLLADHEAHQGLRLDGENARCCPHGAIEAHRQAGARRSACSLLLFKLDFAERQHDGFELVLLWRCVVGVLV
jgi:hypothetical protein